ncbi:MAG: amidohydrolase family protein [Planctomycetota bacterium]
MTLLSPFLASLVLAGGLATDSLAQPEGIAISGAKIVTAAEPFVVNHGVVLIKGGKIEAVGPRREVKIPPDYKVYDVGDAWVVPGLVDAHNHTLGGIRDLNDMVYLTNPELTTEETVHPGTQEYRIAVAGGVTAALLIPGSGTNQAGFGVVAKFGGDTVKESVVRQPGCVKIAQAGNPERYWYGVARSFMNWSLRQVFKKARDYARRRLAWEEAPSEERRGEQPKRDPRFEHWVPVFAHKIPALVHTQWYQVVLETLKMVHDEFGMRTILGHATFEAWRVGEEVARRPDVFIVNGPRQILFETNERRIVGHCWGWYGKGVRENLGVNCDAVGGGYGGVGQEELSYQMAMAVRFGMPDPVQAIKGITIVEARALLLEDRIGSLEVGKDGDVAVFTGNPVDPRNKCLMTFVNGKLVYDAARDGQRW